jgi:hypothetical protein
MQAMAIQPHRTRYSLILLFLSSFFASSAAKELFVSSVSPSTLSLAAEAGSTNVEVIC